MPTTTVLVLLAIAVFAAQKILRVGRRGSHLPPGPPTVPVLGNAHMLPTEYLHFKMTEWAREYGDLYSLKIFNGTFIVISGVSAARELLDKRNSSTADRPPLHIIEVVTDGMNMVGARYSDTWRVQRKTAHTILTPQSVKHHLPIQRAEAIQVMHDLLKRPEGFFTHIRRYSNSVISSVLYGTRSPRYETRTCREFFEVQHLWQSLAEPGAIPPVDFFPVLQHIPERWAPWKTLAKKVRATQRALYFRLMEDCEERVRNGKEVGVFMEDVIKRREEFGLWRDLTAYLGGVMMEGGSDTTSSLLHGIVMVLAVYPHIVRKAQEEIDRVIGDQRLPELQDFEQLPYIQALIKELHRFRPLAPLVPPHSNMDEERYRGYVIPKGAVIWVNLWGIFHDPELFEDPETFNPDRYIQHEYGVKPGVDASDFRHTLQFGFGRRLCPGIHLGNNSLALNAMNLVWGFDFSPATDPSTGKEIPIDISNYERGILTGPRPFQCKITPRSRARAEIIEREFADAVDHAFVKFEDGLEQGEKEWLASDRYS